MDIFPSLNRSYVPTVRLGRVIETDVGSGPVSIQGSQNAWDDTPSIGFGSQAAGTPCVLAFASGSIQQPVVIGLGGYASSQGLSGS